jgi:cell division protein FtsL
MHGKASTRATFDVSPALPPQQVTLEVDRARQLEYRRWLLVGLVLLAAALFDGWQRSVPVSHGYRLEETHRARADEDAIGRRLRLEIASLRAPARIEWLAINQLHLVAPQRNDSMVIERVVPPQQPPMSVVASR